MSNNVYDLKSGKKLDLKVDWDTINKKISEDLIFLHSQKLNATYIILGKIEYRIVLDFFSKQQNRYFAPASINNIPIVLVPAHTMCCCIPSPSDLNKLLL